MVIVLLTILIEITVTSQLLKEFDRKEKEGFLYGTLMDRIDKTMQASNVEPATMISREIRTWQTAISHQGLTGFDRGLYAINDLLDPIHLFLFLQIISVAAKGVFYQPCVCHIPPIRTLQH